MASKKIVSVLKILWIKNGGPKWKSNSGGCFLITHFMRFGSIGTNITQMIMVATRRIPMMIAPNQWCKWLAKISPFLKTILALSIIPITPVTWATSHAQWKRLTRALQSLSTVLTTLQINSGGRWWERKNTGCKAIILTPTCTNSGTTITKFKMMTLNVRKRKLFLTALNSLSTPRLVILLTSMSPATWLTSPAMWLQRLTQLKTGGTTAQLTSRLLITGHLCVRSLFGNNLQTPDGPKSTNSGKKCTTMVVMSAPGSAWKSMTALLMPIWVSAKASTATTPARMISNALLSSVTAQPLHNKWVVRNLRIWIPVTTPVNGNKKLSDAKTSRLLKHAKLRLNGTTVHPTCSRVTNNSLTVLKTACHSSQTEMIG